MKKKNLKSLKLNKKPVSNLQSEDIIGGRTGYCTGSWCWISLNQGPCPK